MVPLTHGIKGWHQADIHPAFWFCGQQLELQSLVPVLLRKPQAQTRDWVPPPGFQLGLHITEDVCTRLLVLEVCEAAEEDNDFQVTAAPKVRAAAKRAPLWRKDSSDMTLQEPGVTLVSQQPPPAAAAGNSSQ